MSRDAAGTSACATFWLGQFPYQKFYDPAALAVARVFILTLLTLSLCACTASWSKQSPAPQWTTGFWFWQYTYKPAECHHEPLDVLFLEVGSINRQAGLWSVSDNFPADYPDAKQYWLVFRCERQQLPGAESIPLLGRSIGSALAQARMDHLNVAGVQLDIDSPTRDLPNYASYLHDVRKALPPGLQLSLTSLLDWFHDGTAIADVIREVDEFVPQFYDVNDRTDSIAAKIDSARWGPIFNRLGKPYRIGISTFGRARLVSSAGGRVQTFRDIVPLDIATNAAFRLETARNAANELVLNYRVTRPATISWTNFIPGDTLQFILATPDSVHAAVESTRRMKGNVAGVVFFRWPSAAESLTLQPDEVLQAVGVSAGAPPVPISIDVIDGRCAAVSCVDLYLEARDPLSPKPLRYEVHSKVAFEYFLPEKNVPIRMTGASTLELSLPPYCERGHLYLGRAVTAQPSQFTVEEQP
jgi:hypothetical protein